VYFGETGRPFRLMPNADFGGNRTVIFDAEQPGRIGGVVEAMADGRSS
jgi:hypothetical protein